MRSPGTSSVTVTGKARFGLISEYTLSLSPDPIEPSTLATPESHSG